MNPASNRYGKPHFELCACPLTWAHWNPNHIMMLCALPHALLWAAEDRWGSIQMFLLRLALMMSGVYRVSPFMSQFCMIGLTSLGVLIIFLRLMLFGLLMNVLILFNILIPMMHKEHNSLHKKLDRSSMKRLNPFKISLLRFWKKTSLKAKNFLRKSLSAVGMFTIDEYLNGMFLVICSFMVTGDFGLLMSWVHGMIKLCKTKMLHLLWFFPILLETMFLSPSSLMCWWCRAWTFRGVHA